MHYYPIPVNNAGVKLLKFCFVIFLTISQVDIYNSHTNFKGGGKMKDFKGKIAVITGAASGIGFGLAERCAKEGMKIVLADVEKGALAQAEKDIKALGAKTLAVKTDVSKSGDVEALAEKTVDTFGAVHLLFNNAGVSAGFTVWGSTLADWQWVLGVNLWGVIYGIHFFLPIMLKQDEESHIVNTSSIMGLFSIAGAPYTVSKHGVVALSEILYRELEQAGHNIGISVLCPAYINTGIFEAERNRPADLRDTGSQQSIYMSDPKVQEMIEHAKQLHRSGMSPQKNADIVFDAIKENRFYILANAEQFKPMIQVRMEDILQERNPTSISLEL
jgi:NAD(P)-dependent dehydrogenase (short-subunit alcohol dehydrogenase family)